MASRRVYFRLSKAVIGLVVSLVTAVVVGLLPGPAAVTAYAATSYGGSNPLPDTCWLEGSNVECPPVFGPPDLIPPKTMEGLLPEAADALRTMEDQAVADVLTEHDLPSSQRAAVLSYAREEALAKLWLRIADAFETPSAQRTARQQAVVDWLGRRYRQMRMVAPPFAAREYARFAGKNLAAFDQLMYTNASEAEIRTFLSGPSEPYNVPDPEQATGGYCKYRPPAPYEGEYNETTRQSCFTPCQNFFGCTPPTPDYQQFVKWGNTHIDSYFDNGAVMPLSAAIAGAWLGSAAVVTAGGAIAGGLAISTIAPLVDAVMPFAAGSVVEMTLVGQGVQLAGTLGGAAVGSALAIAAVAITAAVLVGISVANIDQMAGKLASAIAQSREPVNADDLWNSSDRSGQMVLLTLFVDAVTPSPRQDRECDNLQVTNLWRTWFDGLPVVPFAWELEDLNVYPCLNPIAVPSANETDPFFQVTNVDTGVSESSPTISAAVIDNGSVVMSHTVSLKGDNWFVVERPDGSRWQMLRLTYTDWEGRLAHSWLRRTPSGYQFYGIALRPGEDNQVDLDNCQQCFGSDELRFLGPDGQRRKAKVQLYTPPVGQPTFSAARLESHSAITFDANGFKPANPVGGITYRWRFQKIGCETAIGTPLGCQVYDTSSNRFVPEYGDWQTGAKVTYVWESAGSHWAQVEGTDLEGHAITHDLRVNVASVPATLSLARDCSVTAVPVGCNNYPTSVGAESVVFGGLELPGHWERESVRVDWGDGTGSAQEVGYLAENDATSGIHLTQESSTNPYLYDLRATHTYPRAGYYTVVLAASDQYGASVTKSTVVHVKGASEITFAQPGAKRYGEVFLPQATATYEGSSVTYTAAPDDVCQTAEGPSPQITMVGIGQCTVTAHQQGGGPVFTDAAPVTRTFDVLPAPLMVKVDNKTKTYGEPNPEFTTEVRGLRNGDTAASLGVTVVGPAADSPAGDHDLVASGVTSPNYTVEYTKGRLTVTRAPLTITADDKTRRYGQDKPTYTAEFDGLVNGDTPASITGLAFNGPPKDAHVGTYDIRPDGATNRNYDISFVRGTETVTPAPLSISANDVFRQYGETAKYDVNYNGMLVNGDQSVPGLVFEGAAKEAGVGTYPITVSGSTTEDYDITYFGGTEVVTPAPLTIRVDDKARTYGGASPAYTAKVQGLLFQDDVSMLGGWTYTGAPADAGVGAYPIKAQGAANTNYRISYVDGTETVTKAPLTITAHDKSKVYGAPDPVFTAKYDGLVNGDTSSVVSGLEFASAPTGSDVGTYPIVPSKATSPNYDIAFANGTETITKAPLTVRAQDETIRYGTLGTYTWKGDGWVNGDTDASMDTAPVCEATIQGAAASVTTAPGPYVGAITCAGAADQNYSIDYAGADLTINPVIRLDQAGLPTTVARQATLDGQTVTLPTTESEVGFGTAHTYSFPSVVVDANGVPYMTRQGGFVGPVVTNIQVTASYTTMPALLTAAVTSKGMDQKTANSLGKLWNDVMAGLKAGNVNKTRGALTQFADSVRSQSGKKIQKATADNLLAYAQLVYVSVGGSGTV